MEDAAHTCVDTAAANAIDFIFGADKTMADGVVESADDFKAAGNAAFKAGNFDEAIKQFTSAIELGGKIIIIPPARDRGALAASSFARAALTTDARPHATRRRPDQPRALLQPLGRTCRQIGVHGGTA